jgi:hypothetical protein
MQGPPRLVPHIPHRLTGHVPTPRDSRSNAHVKPRPDHATTLNRPIRPTVNANTASNKRIEGHQIVDHQRDPFSTSQHIPELTRRQHRLSRAANPEARPIKLHRHRHNIRLPIQRRRRQSTKRMRSKIRNLLRSESHAAHPHVEVRSRPRSAQRIAASAAERSDVRCKP